MKLVLIKLMAIIVVFCATWLALSRVNWMELLRVKQMSAKTEEKLGKIVWETIKQTDQEIKNDSLIAPIDSILDKICRQNNINRPAIKLHLLQKSEINAFALPDNQLVIYSGLLKAAKNEAELAGVISHELAHMGKNHVMHKLGEEIGLTMLISVSSGNNGAMIVKKIMKTLSSTAYSRSLENEADMAAVDYLVKSNIDPKPYSDFLSRLSDESDLKNEFSWLNTHPDSKERAQKTLAYSRSKADNYAPVLHAGTWEKMKAAAGKP